MYHNSQVCEYSGCDQRNIGCIKFKDHSQRAGNWVKRLTFLLSFNNRSMKTWRKENYCHYFSLYLNNQEKNEYVYSFPIHQEQTIISFE